MKELENQPPYQFITTKDVQEASNDSPFFFVTQGNACFNAEEMKFLRDLADKEATPASVYMDKTEKGVNNIKSDIAHEDRRSHGVWLHQDKYKWIYDRVWQVALAVNKSYKVDILSLIHISEPTRPY